MIKHINFKFVYYDHPLISEIIEENLGNVLIDYSNSFYDKISIVKQYTDNSIWSTIPSLYSLMEKSGIIKKSNNILKENNIDIIQEKNEDEIIYYLIDISDKYFPKCISPPFTSEEKALWWVLENKLELLSNKEEYI